MRKMYKNEKGITLVALVITIIVLIILAAVSINAVMNEGLITNAKTASERYDEAKMKETISLAYYTAFAAEKGNVTTGGFATQLKNSQILADGEEDNVSYNEENETFSVVVGEVTYTVDRNGNVTVGSNGNVPVQPEPVAITWTQAEDGTISNNVNSTTFTVGQRVTYEQQSEVTQYEVTSAMSGVEGDSQIIKKANSSWYIAGVNGEGRIQLLGTGAKQVKFYGNTGAQNFINVYKAIYNTFYGNDLLETTATIAGPGELDCVTDVYINGGTVHGNVLGTSGSDLYISFYYLIGDQYWTEDGQDYFVQSGSENLVTCTCAPLVTLGPTVIPVAAN